MSKLMSRGVVLTASRLSNFAILALSPLLLVRILDVENYGKYQEFAIYATLFTTICSFGIDRSLTFFLPRYPNHEREFVSQNSALILTFSSACLLLFILAWQPFLQIASYDFVAPLALYVFCFVNLNWLEYYWIAKQRTDLVLYYSAGRLLLRAGVLLGVAYLTRDVLAILWSLAGAEALRLIIVAACLIRAKLLTATLDRSRIVEQVKFAGPVGLAGLMQQASSNIGKLFISSVLGPVALAYYAVASYLLPLVFVVRSSISDVIFPEMVRAKDDPIAALRLWQRSNIVFCVFLFPLFVLCMRYAELFITTLFTDEYRAAVPVFQVYALWLLRRCFTMDVLLRTRGKTAFMLKGTGLSITINLVAMILFYRWFGLIGPAIAYITSETLLELYYAVLVSKEFDLNVAALVDWRSVGSVCVGCVAGIPILLAADYLPGPELVRAAAAALVFIVVCWLVAYRLGVADIGILVAFGLSQILRIRPAR